jgi:magnesium transporter
MDAFASIISNNLNIVMKVLTSITIILTIPTMIFSYYGMNVDGMPLTNAWFPFALSLGVAILAVFLLRKKDLL